MRIGLGFGVGPVRFSQTLLRTGGRRRQRRPLTPFTACIYLFVIAAFAVVVVTEGSRSTTTYVPVVTPTSVTQPHGLVDDAGHLAHHYGGGGADVYRAALGELAPQCTENVDVVTGEIETAMQDLRTAGNRTTTGVALIKAVAAAIPGHGPAVCQPIITSYVSSHA